MLSAEPGRDFEPGPHITSRDTPAGAILVDLARGDCWELNVTGAKMWRLLVELQSSARAVEQAGVVFKQSAARAVSDMRQFVDTLIERGVLVPRPAKD